MGREHSSFKTFGFYSGVLAYIFCLGSYRLLYALNWIYKKMFVPEYSDVQSWMGGVVEIVFFLDFLNYRLRGSSVLRNVALKVDDKVNELKVTVELKVLGRESRVQTAGGELRKRRVHDDMEYIDV